MASGKNLRTACGFVGSETRGTLGQRPCHGGQFMGIDKKPAKSGVFNKRRGNMGRVSGQLDRVRSVTLKAGRGGDEGRFVCDERV